MELKRYSVGAFVFMLIVWVGVYSVTTQSASFTFLGFSTPDLQIAFWVIVPLFFFYLASLLHMVVHTLIGSFKLHRWEKDHLKLINALRDALIGVPERNYQYKTDPYKHLGKLIDNVAITPSNTLENVGNVTLDETLQVLRNVQAEHDIDTKKLNFPANSALMIRYHLGRLGRGELSPESVLSRIDFYGETVALAAYERYVRTAALSGIVKFQKLLRLSSLLLLMERINAPENALEIDGETLLSLIQKVTMSKAEWIAFADAMAKNMLPDQRIGLLEVLSAHNDDAMEAYLYTLYDLQMIDAANEILNNTAANEFVLFKAYRDLKKANKSYDIALFIHS